jgi:hypothetical protein
MELVAAWKNWLPMPSGMETTDFSEKKESL